MDLYMKGYKTNVRIDFYRKAPLDTTDLLDVERIYDLIRRTLLHMRLS